MTGAGYHGTDPEVQAAHDKVFYREKDGLARALVDELYRRHASKMLRLEEEAATAENAVDEATRNAGQRMRSWLRFVRHCITVHIVAMRAPARPQVRPDCRREACKALARTPWAADSSRRTGRHVAVERA